MREIHQRILATLTVVVIMLTLGVMAQRYASLDWLVAREVRLRHLVHDHSIMSWMIGFLIYTCLSMIPGTAGKSVICGWLFGFWAGVLMVDGALTVAALATFLTCRFLFRDAVEFRLGIHLARFRRRLESNAGFYLLMLRLLHAPFSLVNYMAGATNFVPTQTFWWTTQLGVLPGTMIFVFAGTRIPTLSIIAEQGVWALMNYRLFAALATTAALPLIIKGLAAVLSPRLVARNAGSQSASSPPHPGETDACR